MELKSVLTVTLYLIYSACADRVTYKKVCYYTNWSQYRPDVGKFLPNDIDPFLCTHVIFAFAKLVGNRIVAREWNDETVPWKKGLYEHVTDLKKINPKLKVLLSVGGWNAGGKPFSDLAATAAGRKEFATTSVTFLRKRHFDGLDIDWEFPGSNGGAPSDKENLSLLLKEVSTVFEKEERAAVRDRLLLSIAVPASQDKIDQGYKVPDVSLYCDMINVMTYNYHGMWDKSTGHHSALFKRKVDTTEYQSKLNVAWTMNYWIRMGAQANKLILGFPQFGRGFTLTDSNKKAVGDGVSGGSVSGTFTKEAGFLAYYEICKMLKSGAAVTWDDVQKVPHLVLGDQWIGFDNERSIREKVKWFKNYKFGGIMVWALPLDDFRGDQCSEGRTYPILRNIIDELNRPDTAPGIANRDSSDPIQSDGLTPTSSNKIISDTIPFDSFPVGSSYRVNETMVNMDTTQEGPLLQTSSSNAKILLENAKDQSGHVSSAKDGRNKPVSETGKSETKKKKNTDIYDTKKEKLSDVIINPEKAVITKVKSSKEERKQLLKSIPAQEQPLIEASSNKIENRSPDLKSDGKARSGLSILETSGQVKNGVRKTATDGAQTPVVTGTVLSDSLKHKIQSHDNIIAKANVLDELSAFDNGTEKSTEKQTKTVITNSGETVPLLKTVTQANSTPSKDDNRKIVGKHNEKSVTNKKKKTENKSETKVQAGTVPGTHLSSAIITKGKTTKKIGTSSFTGGPPVYSAPDLSDLQLAASHSAAKQRTDKQRTLDHLKDKNPILPIIQSDTSAGKVENNAEPESPSVPPTASTTVETPYKKTKPGKNTAVKMSKSTKQSTDKTDTATDSKTQSETGKENGKSEISKFTSRKLLQMTDTSFPGMPEERNEGGLGGMINSLFGMMSGFTRGQRPQERRSDVFPIRSSVTDDPFSFNTGPNDIRGDNRLARQRFRNGRQGRTSTSRDRPSVAINNRESSVNTIDRTMNTRDRSLSRRGRERSIAVDRASNVPSRSNQFPIETLTDVSPLPTTANPFDSIDPRDQRLRGGRSSLSRASRTLGIQERIRGTPLEDTRTPRERALDALILSEQLPDPGPLISQNTIRPMGRDQLRNEAELLLTRDQLGINDPIQREILQAQIRDPALIRSREPGLVETLRRRMSDTGRSRGNPGVATNIQTTERGRGRSQSDTRQANGGRFPNSEASMLSRNSNSRRNIAVDSFNNRNRIMDNARSVQRRVSRPRTVIGLQGSGTDRQNSADGTQRTSLGTQSSGVSTVLGNDRQRIATGTQGPGRDRGRNSLGRQNVASTRRRTTIGINDAGNERQRASIGITNAGTDRQRTNVAVQSSDRQRTTAGVPGTRNNRQRTPISVESTGTGTDRRQSVGTSQRAMRGGQGLGTDRQRSAVGVQTSDRQRAVANGQRAGNDRQRPSIGIAPLTGQNGRVSRQRSGIGVQRSSMDRQRAAIGVANDRQRSVIGVQRLGNERPRAPVGVQGSETDRKRSTIGVQNGERQRTAIEVQRTGNDRQRSSVAVQGSTSDRQITAFGVQNIDRQRTSIGVQRSGNGRQRTSVGVQSSLSDRQKPSIGIKSIDRQRTAIGVQRSGNDRQRTSVGVQSDKRTAAGVQQSDRQRPSIGVQRQRTIESKDHQRTVVGIQRSGNDRQQTTITGQRPDISLQQTAVGVQAPGNNRQQSVVNEGRTTTNSRRIVATNSDSGRITDLQLPSIIQQNDEMRKRAQNTILNSKSSSLAAILGSTSPESNQIVAVSESNWKTGPEKSAISGNGAKPVALMSNSQKRNAIENSIEELLAQISAQQPNIAIDNVGPTVSLTPTEPPVDPSIHLVTLNNIENSFLNSLGPPIQILNETKGQPSVIPIANNDNFIGGTNTIDLINSLAANRMSMPDSPMTNSLTAENILAAVAASQPSPTIDVVNKPIVLEIQPQILPTKPPLNNDITDVLVQLLRENLLNQKTPSPTTPAPPPPTTPAALIQTTSKPFKQVAIQTPNQVLVSTGGQPKDFPPLPPPPRRQTSIIATNETVVANIRPQLGLTKADVLWKWEA
ncbi:uncharacterized protein LOC132561275 [Ylistrum balloti]|uniref:uncharacterized protein LOC132561275 n=1 Tax=Ylistrum balloti TaxID=509963 RepID=UPI002905C785|nr:uncharacterized protein LOC132561275 [Ylistrum balloti]